MYINRVLCKSFIIRCLHSAQVFLLKKEYTWNITGNTSEEIQNFPSSSLSVFRINFPKVECLMQPIQRHSQKEFQQECVKIWNSVVHIHPMIPIQDRPENRKNERSATPSVGLSCTPVRVSRYETRRPPRVLHLFGCEGLSQIYPTKEALRNVTQSYYITEGSVWRQVPDVDVLVFDLFASGIEIRAMLSLLDGSAWDTSFRVPQYNPKAIIFLSVSSPREQYPRSERETPQLHSAYLRRMMNYFNVKNWSMYQIQTCVSAFLRQCKYY